MNVNITENAQSAILKQLEEKNRENSYVRIAVKSFG
jgi:Fe-S cluster assembly iron-binding protein IscA